MIDINKAKQKILDLAIRGKLTKQLKSDGNAADLLVEIQKEKEKLIKDKKIRNDINVISDDIEEPFEIPENWAWCKLDQISKVISKGTTPRGGKIAYKNSGIRFLRAENILGFNKIDTHNLKYIDETIHNSILKRSILLENDILISIAGTLGRTGLVTKDLLPLNSNQAISFIRLINDKKIIPNYVLYVLNLNSVKYILMNKKVDMAIPNISLETISNCQIPIPPIAEQNRIVEKVEQLFDILDKIDEAQKKYQKDKEILKSKIIEAGIRGKLTKQLKSDGNASDLLDEIRKEKEKLIKEGKIKRDKKETYIYKNPKDNLYYEKYQDGTEKCIQDELPFEIPENWVWCKLGDIGKWGAGATPLTSNTDYYEYGNIPWILTGDLNDAYIDKTKHYITIKALNECSLEIREKGSVLIAMYGATIGKLAILKIDATMNQACCACTVYKGINNVFLFYYLLYYKKFFISKGSGGAQPNISKDKIIKTEFPLPPTKEQERVVTLIEKIFYIINNGE